jgi:hypothetical protein
LPLSDAVKQEFQVETEFALLMKVQAELHIALGPQRITEIGRVLRRLGWIRDVRSHPGWGWGDYPEDRRAIHQYLTKKYPHLPNENWQPRWAYPAGWYAGEVCQR